jgi:hypothetical protein
MIRLGRCRKCGGRGWEKRADRDWPDACAECGGFGEYSARAVAELVRVSVSSVYRFLKNGSVESRSYSVWRADGERFERVRVVPTFRKIVAFFESLQNASVARPAEESRAGLQSPSGVSARTPRRNGASKERR